MVALNGMELGPITPGKGLRQGDSLSPYLFFMLKGCLTSLKGMSIEEIFMGREYVGKRLISRIFFLLMTTSFSSEQICRNAG